VLLRNRNGIPCVTHTSAKRGVVLDEIRGTLLTDLAKVRRLTIGDHR
jgi:hypothetical protein